MTQARRHLGQQRPVMRPLWRGIGPPEDKRNHDHHVADRVHDKGCGEPGADNQNTRQRRPDRPADIDPHGVQRNGRLQAVTRHKLGHHRLPRRRHERRAGAYHQRKQNQKHGRHKAQPDKRGQHADDGRQHQVDDDQHPPLVQPVSQCTGNQGKQKDRQGRRRLHQRDNPPGWNSASSSASPHRPRASRCRCWKSASPSKAAQRPDAGTAKTLRFRRVTRRWCLWCCSMTSVRSFVHENVERGRIPPSVQAAATP